MIEDEIEKVEVSIKTQDFTPIWWLVKLKDQPTEFLLHNNWIAQHGVLKAGDRVEYEVAKVRFDQHSMFDKLRKVEVEEAVEEEMTKLVSGE